MATRNTLRTVPSEFEMGSQESLPLTVDFSANLGASETITDKSCSIEREDGTAIPDQTFFLNGSPDIDGQSVIQRVEGIAEDRVYLVRYDITTSLGNQWSAVIRVIGVNT